MNGDLIDFLEFKIFADLPIVFGDEENFSKFHYNLRNINFPINQIKKLVSDWNSKNKNLVFVTHYSVITAITTAVPSSGEIVITDRNFEVLGKIKTK